jgi:hypothetical protein
MSGFKRKPMLSADELTAALRGHASELRTATGGAKATARKGGEGGKPRKALPTVQVNRNASEPLARIIAEEAGQVESIGKIARWPIPYRIILTRWNPKGLSDKATLEDVEVAGFPRIKQHVPELVAFQKNTFTGIVPLSGLVGIQMNRTIGELAALEALPAKPQEKAA